MTIKQVFRLVYTLFFVFLTIIVTILFLIYANQLDIEENAGLTASQDRDLLQANLYIKLLAGVLALLVVLLILLYRVVNDRIARPVGALLEHTKRVQNDQTRMTDQIIEVSIGNLDADFKTETPPLILKHADEFKELATAHNAMIENLGMTGMAIGSIVVGMKTARDKLSDVNRWLEKTVEERTRDLRQAHAELEKAHQDLKSLDKAKSDFLRMVSHEIRTPLNGIQGFTYLMKDMPQAPEVAAIFDLLELSVKRLERFSMVALLITELEAGNKSIHRDHISPEELITPILVSLDEKIKAKTLHIKIEGDMIHALITGDKRMLPMCVDSILDNAIHYSEPGGEITIRSEIRDGILSLSFMDRGCGFSTAVMQNLFRIFTPGEEHIDENVGLDLALAKMIMEAHGGAIQATNNPDGGACVALKFAI
jgi:signal transduction histidine kinase